MPAIVLFILIILRYYTSKLLSIKTSVGIGKAQSNVELFFFMAHSDTQHAVGLLWTSDQSDAGTFT